MNTISFPGLGIGPFTLNEIAIKIPFLGNRSGIAWYGIIITFGIILAFLYALTHAKREGVKSDDIIDLAIFTVPSAIIGARLYYVIFAGGYSSFYDVVAVWNGGLAIYGGIIGGAIAVAIVSLVKKIKPLKLFDLLAPALLIGQAIGRWGNFFNAEAFGAETDVLWRMGIQTESMTTMHYYHPTFLYESLWNALGLLLLVLLYRKKKYDGQIIFAYVAWYGLGRMFIEGLRTDSLYWGTIRISQLLAFITFIAATILFVVFGIRARKKRLEAEAYDLQYAEGEDMNSESEQSKESENADSALSNENGPAAENSDTENNTEDKNGEKS